MSKSSVLLVRQSKGSRVIPEPDPTDENAINDIFKMKPDGSGVVKLARSSSFNSDPVWSPDGRKILFLQAREFEGGFGIGLATMNPDGTDRRFISSDPQEMHQPDWESIP